MWKSVLPQKSRITLDPEAMGGKLCIRGMGVTVGMIGDAMSAGRTVEELLAGFPYLHDSDIGEALAFAARLAQGHEIRLASECTLEASSASRPCRASKLGAVSVQRYSRTKQSTSIKSRTPS